MLLHTCRSPGSGLGMPALHPQRYVASITEGSKAWGQGEWVIWHTRGNPAPEWSAMYKTSMANVHMVKKRRLQDKNMIFLPSGGASTTATQTAERAVKYPRKKPKIWKECRMFFHLQTSLGQNKIYPVQYVESNFHPEEGRGKPATEWWQLSKAGFFSAQQAEEVA